MGTIWGPRRGQVAGQVTGLPGHPLCGRVRRDADDVKLAGAMLEERQYVQPCAGDRVQMEEVRGDDSLGLSGKKLAPGGASTARSRVDASAFRIVQTVDGAIRCPRRASSPWILWWPHRGFSRAKRSTNFLTTAAVGGRPAWICASDATTKHMMKRSTPSTEAVISRLAAVTDPERDGTQG